MEEENAEPLEVIPSHQLRSMTCGIWHLCSAGGCKDEKPPLEKEVSDGENRASMKQYILRPYSPKHPQRRLDDLGS